MKIKRLRGPDATVISEISDADFEPVWDEEASEADEDCDEESVENSGSDDGEFLDDERMDSRPKRMRYDHRGVSPDDMDYLVYVVRILDSGVEMRAFGMCDVNRRDAVLSVLEDGREDVLLLLGLADKTLRAENSVRRNPVHALPAECVHEFALLDVLNRTSTDVPMVIVQRAE